MKFEDVELGDELPTEHPDISMPRVFEFTDAAHMVWPRFRDHDAAKKEGLPGALVPGIMSQALLAAMIHRWAPGCRILSLDTVFRGHVVVDTTPTLSGAVTDVDTDARVVEVDLTLTAADGRTGVMGTAKVAFD